MSATTTAITYVIPGARTLDQLNEPTFDGQADEDKNDNCLPDSLAEGLNMLVGGGALKYVGDELHDAEYGQGYIGPQAAWKYVNYCNNAGVWLHAISGTQAGLVATIHREVSAGHPVIVTMPSDWATPYLDPVHPSGSTHVGLAVGIGPSAIRVMNPWHGFMQDAADSWWEPRLCEGEVWVMEKVSGTVSISTNPTAGPTGFFGLDYTSDPQVWSCHSTGKTLAHGFLAFYQGLRSVNGAVATHILGLPISGEYITADGKTRQDFERGSLIYDANASNPWMIYCAPVGKELQASQAQVAQAQQAVAQASLDAQVIAQQKQQIDDLTAKVQELEAQLAAAQQPPTPAPTPTPAPAPIPTPPALPAITAEDIAAAAGQAFTAACVAALGRQATTVSGTTLA